MNADTILKALANKYRAPEWAFFKEVRLGTGFGGYGTVGSDVDKRMDAWALHTWPSSGYQPTGFEVKVSRSDFLRDVKSDKYRAYLPSCQHFYFVTPKDLVKPEEIPDGIGLIWVYPLYRKIQNYVRIVKRTPFKRPDDLPTADWGFLASICRRIAKAEAPPTAPTDPRQGSLFTWYRRALWDLKWAEDRRLRESKWVAEGII